MHSKGGGGFNQVGGRCCKKYAGSKGLMPQVLKPLSMFWGVIASTKAFVYNSTNEAGLAALPLQSLGRFLSKCLKAPFRALKTVRCSGCMTSVKWAGRTTISTPRSLHSVMFDNVRWVLEPSTIITTQPYLWYTRCAFMFTRNRVEYNLSLKAPVHSSLVKFA